MDQSLFMKVYTHGKVLKEPCIISYFSLLAFNNEGSPFPHTLKKQLEVRDVDRWKILILLLLAKITFM